MTPIRFRIKEAMMNRGMKQADLVRKTGISKSTISGYLTGRYIPRQNSIYLLAQALDVDIDWLMGFESPMIESRSYYYEKSCVILRELDDEKLKKAYHTLLVTFDKLDELKNDL